tara:strand:+ start:569 stop:1600 length:1032 start_codon:yes stop_codon:yes gene_type:complete
MADFGAGLEGLQQHIFSHLVTPTTYMGENKDMRVLAVILLASSAYAQTLTLNLHTGNEPLGFSVQMEDISVEGLKLNFGVALAPTPYINATFRNSRSFGPIGNLRLSGAASVSKNGDYFFDVSGQAAYGSIAGKVTLAMGNTALWTFYPETQFALDSSTLGFVSTNWQQLSFDLSYRPSRMIILNVSPCVFLTGSDLGGFIRAISHFHRVIGNYSIKLEAEGLTNHPQNSDYFNVAATYLSPMRHSSTWQVGLTAGASSTGINLGTRLEGTHSFQNQAEIVVSFVSEPYKSDFNKHHLLTEIIFPLPEPGIYFKLFSGLAKRQTETMFHAGATFSIDVRPNTP